MEQSLFAEAFSEMLARDYGEVILAALYHERRALAPSPAPALSVSGCGAGVRMPAARADPARACSACAHAAGVAGCLRADVLRALCEAPAGAAQH